MGIKVTLKERDELGNPKEVIFEDAAGWKYVDGKLIILAEPDETADGYDGIVKSVE